MGCFVLYDDLFWVFVVLVTWLTSTCLGWVDSLVLVFGDLMVLYRFAILDLCCGVCVSVNCDFSGIDVSGGFRCLGRVYLGL